MNWSICFSSGYSWVELENMSAVEASKKFAFYKRIFKINGLKLKYRG